MIHTHFRKLLSGPLDVRRREVFRRCAGLALGGRELSPEQLQSALLCWGESAEALGSWWSLSAKGPWVKTNGIPFWLAGEFTTQFGLYFSGDWDVHWGYGILTHGHISFCASLAEIQPPLSFAPICSANPPEFTHKPRVWAVCEQSIFTGWTPTNYRQDMHTQLPTRGQLPGPFSGTTPPWASISCLRLTEEAGLCLVANATPGFLSAVYLWLPCKKQLQHRYLQKEMHLGNWENRQAAPMTRCLAALVRGDLAACAGSSICLRPGVRNQHFCGLNPTILESCRLLSDAFHLHDGLSPRNTRFAGEDWLYYSGPPVVDKPNCLRLCANMCIHIYTDIYLYTCVVKHSHM